LVRKFWLPSAHTFIHLFIFSFIDPIRRSCCWCWTPPFRRNKNHDDNDEIASDVATAGGSWWIAWQWDGVSLLTKLDHILIQQRWPNFARRLKLAPYSDVINS
jgi:hypothetical protein